MVEPSTVNRMVARSSRAPGAEERKQGQKPCFEFFKMGSLSLAPSPLFYVQKWGF